MRSLVAAIPLAFLGLCDMPDEPERFEVLVTTGKLLGVNGDVASPSTVRTPDGFELWEAPRGSTANAMACAPDGGLIVATTDTVPVRWSLHRVDQDGTGRLLGEVFDSSEGYVDANGTRPALAACGDEVLFTTGRVVDGSRTVSPSRVGNLDERIRWTAPEGATAGAIACDGDGGFYVAAVQSTPVRWRLYHVDEEDLASDLGEVFSSAGGLVEAGPTVPALAVCDQRILATTGKVLDERGGVRDPSQVIDLTTGRTWTAPEGTTANALACDGRGGFFVTVQGSVPTRWSVLHVAADERETDLGEVFDATGGAVEVTPTVPALARCRY